MVFLDLFWTFFKIGLFTFGGGYAMIPMISTEIVAKGWLDSAALVDFIAVSESTPGPFAVNIATFIGNSVAGSGWLGVVGALCATLGVVLPSFIIILIVSKFFFSFKDNRYVAGALSGIRPAVVGLIAAAAVSILAKNVLSTPFSFAGINWLSLGLTVGLFALSRVKFGKKKLHPIAMIGISAALGIVLYGLCGL